MLYNRIINLFCTLGVIRVKHFIRFLMLLVILLAIFVAFQDRIVFNSEELYYSWKENKTLQVGNRNYEDDLQNDKYWNGRTFLLDVYATDLGYIPAVKRFEPQLMNGEKLTIWRCGKRKFSVDNKKNTFIDVVGDEWEELITTTEYVDDGFSIRLGDVVLNDVDEETVIYAVSTILNLRKNDSLRSASDGVRCDLEDYHTSRKGVLG